MLHQTFLCSYLVKKYSPLATKAPRPMKPATILIFPRTLPAEIPVRRRLIKTKAISVSTLEYAPKNCFNLICNGTKDKIKGSKGREGDPYLLLLASLAGALFLMFLLCLYSFCFLVLFDVVKDF